MKLISVSWCAACIIILTSTSPAHADGGWAEQSIPLQAGWNLVWIEVDPVPDDPAEVLYGLNWESVWSFVPGRAAGDRGTWVCNLRGQPAFLNTLTRLQGNRGYFIRTNAPGTLSLIGRPVNRFYRFSMQAPNMFGARLDPGYPPTFAEQLSFPGVLPRVLSIHGWDGSTHTVQLDSDVLQQDAAWWVEVSQDLPYAGPIQVSAPPEGLQFRTRGYSQTVTIEVPEVPADPPSSSEVLTVKALPSAVPPLGYPDDAAAGDASWLQYRDADGEWAPFPETGATVTIPDPADPGASRSQAELEIRCVRAGRAPATIADTDSLYQGLIGITDSKGNRVLLAAGMEITPVEGLWVGQARLTDVSVNSLVPNPLDPSDPLYEAAGTSLNMALILEIPGKGDPQLLDKVCVESDRDGRTLKFRYNAILFHESVSLTGTLDGNGTGGSLTGSIIMEDIDALNPYRHRYNPAHLNGYEITRDITLTFAAEDPDPVNAMLGLADSVGDNELVGTYREVISGVSLEPITVEGFFRLFRRSETAPLPGCP